MSNKLEFKVSSALKNIVGRDLITNDNVAVFELVKNSYDAKAKNVIIDILPDSISITDNGKGMTLSDIKDKWLFLAYSAKKDDSEDENIDESFRDIIQERQYYAGAKGVGRFSADRLGRFLKMTTKTLESEVCEVVSLDWSLFDEDQEDEFTSIKVDHTTIEFNKQFPDSKKHGTVIEITGLYNLWTREELLTLRRFLEKLINPFALDDKYSIEIICEREKVKDFKEKEKHKKVNGLIQNTIIEALSIRTTRLDQYTKNGFIYTKVLDRETLMYEIREKNRYDLLDDFNVSILFLNRAARNTFTRRMGLQSTQYGSLFLYKNGVRVLPYGEDGDDSWGLDRRKQQGHSRYLGTRDLLGHISITTKKHEEFKETTSRDGGLINTNGAKEIHELFKNATRRLERYVVGVLWGEGFLRENYFVEKALVDSNREALKEDQEKDDYQSALKNVGSRIDYTQIIKGLAQDKNIEIINYNKNMTQFVANELNVVKIDILRDLEEIATTTKDPKLKLEIEKLRTSIIEERKKREEAEEKARKAEERAQEAERKAQEAEERAKFDRIAKEKAELEKEAERQKRKQAELDKRESDLKAKESERKAQEEKEKRKVKERELEKETKQGIFQRAIIGKEKEQILGLQHQINHSSSRIKNNINRLLKYLSKLKIDEQALKYVSIISLEAAKIESISNYVTSANFDLMASEIKQDIIRFFEDYINEMYLIDNPILKSALNISVSNSQNLKYQLEIRPLEITTFIDNFIQNAEKAEARNIAFDFSKTNENSLLLIIKDDGVGIPPENMQNIYNFGFTTTNGAGIGLFNIKSVIERMKWKINVFSEGKGVKFQISIL